MVYVIGAPFARVVQAVALEVVLLVEAVPRVEIGLVPE